MSDNYFDKELQDQLEGYRAEYNPADWAAMEHMLERKKWYMLPWLRTVAVAALVTGAALTTWILLDGSSKEEQSLTEQTTRMEEGQLTDPIQSTSENSADEAQFAQIDEEASFESASDNQVFNSSEQAEALVQHEKETEENTALADAATYPRDQFQSGSTHSTSSGNQANQETVSQPNIGVQMNQVVRDKQASQKDPKIDYSTRPSWAEMPEGYVSRKVRYMEPLEPLTIDWLGPKPRITGGGTDALREYRQHPLRLWIGAVGIPAMNFVSNAKPGFHIGGRLGVDFNQKLSLETGLGYTQFAYDEVVENPAPPAILAQDAYLHRSTKGDLRYLEIPLRINYTLGNPGRLEPYVSAGASMFITLNENYVFRYESNPTYNAPLGTFNETKQDTLQLENFGGVTTANTVNLDASAGTQFTTTRKPSTTAENVQLEKFYLMGQLAAGVDYLIAPSTTVNVGVNYRFPVSSFGVENRTLHTVGLEIGVKHLL